MNTKFIALFLFLVFGQNLFAQSKPNICTVTLNSEDEKFTFKKRLGDKANFIELASSEASSQGWGWFRNSCKKLKAQLPAGGACDVILISGHFAGTFFGNKAPNLSVEELEDLSCNDECPEFFKKSTEVFLMGCNTLASKDPVGRTEEEYRAALHTHPELSASQIDQIVNFLYGSIGATMESRMRRIFYSEKPLLIYGFHSKGPLGPRARPSLENYLLDVPNYANHLQDISQRRILKNVPLARNMSEFNFHQVGGISAQDPEMHLRENICSLYRRQLPRLQKLLKVQELISSPQRVEYIPSMATFFRQNKVATFSSEEMEVFNQIHSMESVRMEVMSLVKSLEKSTTLYVDLSLFLRDMQWLSPSELNQKMRLMILDLIHGGVDRNEMAAIRHVQMTLAQNQVIIPLSRSDLNEDFFNSVRGLEFLSHLPLEDESLLTGIASHLDRDSDPLLESSIRALGMLKVKNQNLVNKVFSKLDHSSRAVQTTTALAIWRLASQDQIIQQKTWQKFMQMKDDLRIGEYLLRALAAGETKDPEILKGYIDLLNDPKYKSITEQGLQRLRPTDPGVVRYLQQTQPGFKIFWSI